MGDRGNICIKDRANRIYLYTHWRGSRLPAIVRESLTRGQDRWTDGTYIARILFCDLIKNQERETTGFGISTEICDNEHPILVVDCDTQEVYTEDEDSNEISALPRSSFKSWVTATDTTFKSWASAFNAFEVA